MRVSSAFTSQPPATNSPASQSSSSGCEGGIPWVLDPVFIDPSGVRLHA